MARQAEPFVVLLSRTIRTRWRLMCTLMMTCFVLVMCAVSLLPPRYMAVGLVRIGFVGPGFGMLGVNTVATEAGSTGFIERVKNEVGVPEGDMVARVRFQSSIVELRAYAPTEKDAVAMVQTAAGWMVEEHKQLIEEVFVGAKALYVERFGKIPMTEETIFQRNSMALEMVEEVKSVNPGLLPSSFLALFLGLFLGLVVIVFLEIAQQHEAS